MLIIPSLRLVFQVLLASHQELLLGCWISFDFVYCLRCVIAICFSIERTFLLNDTDAEIQPLALALSAMDFKYSQYRDLWCLSC